MIRRRFAASSVEPWVGLVMAVVLIGAILRLLGLRTELWMDEILSLKLVAGIGSPLGVFTSIHHDNNHYLNSLWLFVVGANARWWQLRLASVVCGILLVPLSYRAAAVWGRPTAVLAAFVVGMSNPMIHFSSEARGYAQVLVLALTSWIFFRSWFQSGKAGWAVAYALAASLGFLSHLSFATVFAAFLVWSAFDVLSVPGQRVRSLRRHVSVQAMPAMTIALLYLVDVRHLLVAGGPVTSMTASWSAAANLLVGGASGWLATTVALLMAGAVASELVSMFRNGDSEALFFAFVIFFPFASGAISFHGYDRYYLTALLFALLLFARFVAKTVTPGGRYRWGVAVVLVAGVSLNLVEAVRFLETGRGKYLEAVADMAAVSTTDAPRVAGNHDLGNLLTIEYYERYAPGRPSFEYFCGRTPIPECQLFIGAPDPKVHPPEFFIVASTRNRFAPPAHLDISNLAEYTLMAVYPKYGLSGLAWAVYRSSGHTRGVVSRASPVP